MRSSFVFYKDWWEVLAELPADDRLKAYESVFAYAFAGKVPEDKFTRTITGLMRTAIDRDVIKFERISERRREAANSRWKSDANASKSMQVMQKQNLHYEKEKEIEKETEKENKEISTKVDTKKDELSLPRTKSALQKKQQDMLKRKEEFKDELSQFADRYPKDMLNDFYEYWTEPNKSHTKMLFETKQTWDTSRRLSRWERNSRKGGVQ